MNRAMTALALLIPTSMEASFVNVDLCANNTGCAHIITNSPTGPVTNSLTTLSTIQLNATTDFGVLRASADSTFGNLGASSYAISGFSEDLILGASSGTLRIDFAVDGNTLVSSNLNIGSGASANFGL